MARNKTQIGEKYNAPFPTALRRLMDERGETQENIARAAEKTRQTVSQYVNGISEPGYETLVKIADHFDVSIDFLLGRTADPKRNPSAMDELGLSGDALIHLRGCNKDGSIGAMNLLLENYRFIRLIAQIGHFIGNVSHNTMLSKRYQENAPVIPGKRSDYHKVQYVIQEEHIMSELSEQINSQIPELKGNFSIHVGSYFVENQKRSIEDSFSEILRQISNYDEFRENIFRLSDFFKER